MGTDKLCTKLTIIVCNRNCGLSRSSQVGIRWSWIEGESEVLCTLNQIVIIDGDVTTLLVASARKHERVTTNGTVVYTITWKTTQVYTCMAFGYTELYNIYCKFPTEERYQTSIAAGFWGFLQWTLQFPYFMKIHVPLTLCWVSNYTDSNWNCPSCNDCWVVSIHTYRHCTNAFHCTEESCTKVQTQWGNCK